MARSLAASPPRPGPTWRRLGSANQTRPLRQPTRPPTAPTSAPTSASAAHLLSRATFAGPTPEALAAVAAAGGPQAWLERQLAPDPSADASLDALLAARYPLAHATAPQVWAKTQQGSWDAGFDLARWTLAKNIWSANQLSEVMCEFWSNHLNITTPGGEAWASKPDNDRDVIRAHALGRFDDMLAASVLSPAMLSYLTNTSNRKKAPDENLGRELMELHSVGVDAGYGQTGVVNASRALTGLSVWNPWNGGTPQTYGTFRNVPTDHWTGPLQVLSWSHPNTDPARGVAVAQSLARYLANHPATATRIATKLAVRFVSDRPPASLVQRLAAVYSANGTAIVPVLRALFTSPEFAASAGAKYRRPIEDLAATARTLGWALDPAATDAFDHLYWSLWQMGQTPLNWPAPDGYPDIAGAWVGTGVTLSRWNAHLVLAAGWLPAGLSRPGLASRVLPTPAPPTRSGLATELLTRLLGGASAAQVAALVGYLGGDGPVRPDDVGWRLPYLVALVLDAPQWSAR